MRSMSLEEDRASKNYTILDLVLGMLLTMNGGHLLMLGFV